MQPSTLPLSYTPPCPVASPEYLFPYLRQHYARMSGWLGVYFVAQDGLEPRKPPPFGLHSVVTWILICLLSEKLIC